jgi:hypothetical protein
MKFTTLGFLFLLLSTSCKMMENAEKAAVNSKKAADNSESIKELSASFYISAVTGGSEDTRREALAEMKNAESFDLKARYASSFIKAQTYQLISPIMKNISVGDFERLYNDALLEDIPIVARAIAECMPKKEKFKVISTKGCDGDVKAIAVSLQEKNKLYYQFSGHENIEMLSMLDIVMDAFTAHYIEKRTLEDLTEVQKKVLYYRREFLYALELRHKFLPLVAISKISEINTGTVKKLKMIFKSWSPLEKSIKTSTTKNTVNQGYSSSEFELALKVLNQSIATREFLRTLGTSSLELPVIVKKVLSNMELDPGLMSEKVHTDVDVAVEKLLNP